MEGLHCEPCQIRGTKNKAHKEAEALEERPLPSETWSNNSNKATGPGPVHSSEVVVEGSAISIPFSETLLGLIVKMPASLQPVCCAGSPVLLPVQVQQAGEIEPETIATPVITPPLGSHTLPLIFDQPQVHYSLLENNGLSQNLSLTIDQSHSCKGKSENTAMYSSEFISSLQQLFSSPHCRGSSSFSSNAFGASFIPPDSTLSHLYTGSPPVSLLPPATLLVPFPFVVPLPVPLPIPIPIPFIPDSCLSRPSHTIKTSRSTQTEYISVCTHNRMSGYDFLQLPKQPFHPVSQEEVLDLTVKVVPMQTNREVQFHQNHALDLSVANKSCFNTNLIHHGRNSGNVDSTKLILPMKYSPTQATNQPNGYSDMEFSMHYKWTTEKRYEKYSLKYSNQNGSVVSPKHIPRVTQSTKDASGRICEQIVRSPPGQVLKKKIDKKKRLNSQNINNSPIKKQHLMSFCSSK
ncbi:retinoic acid-induced protein 2 [Tachysurus vachellii]|uniref:retinoic acid-induced protein 2 n=1 Tax=Tachysurus vachellii TaxID=175792 RepID=UPI00296A9C33|nr:retinoic acid-induced protein 2 [Tachysurus vachellii]